ncbi:hypothetical protein [Nonomuraea sp. NPDC003201]
MIETAPAIASAAAGGDRPVVGSYDTCEQAREAVAFLAAKIFRRTESASSGRTCA